MSSPEPMVPLKHLASINRSSLPEDTADDFEFAYVDIGSVTTGEMSIPEQTIAFGGAPSRARRLARAGDVVISTVRTYLRAVAQVPNVDARLVFSTGFAAVHPDEDKVDGRYLAYAMQADPFTEAVEAMSVGISYPAVNASDVGNVKVWAPSLAEQRAIADFLDQETAQIDAMVDAQERLVRLLEERRDSAIQRAVTKGLHPTTDLSPTSELWIDSMPEHWSVAPIGYYFEVTLGKMLDAGKPARADDSHLPYLRAANIQDRGLELGDVKEMPFGPEEQARLDIRAGDLMVVEGGAIGTAVLITTDMPGWSFQKTVNRVRSRGHASTAYLRYVIRTIRDRGLFDMSGNKSTIAHLTAEKLAATRIPLPSIEEQQEIAAYLDDTTRRIDAMIAKARESIALMKERRAAVISAAVTGRIDVRTGIEQVERDLEEARA